MLVSLIRVLVFSFIEISNLFFFSIKISAALPPSLNFLSVTGDYCEGEMLTASYGYIGGHEGKSLYQWYLHEVCVKSGQAGFAMNLFILMIERN